MGITRTLFALGLVAVVVLVSIGRAEYLEEAEIPAERWYLVNVKGKAAGYVHAIRKVSLTGASEILLEHDIVSDSEKERVSVKMQTVCDNDEYLFPITILAEVKKLGEAPATLTVSIEKQIPYGCSKGKMRAAYRTPKKTHKRDRDIPEHTVTEYGLLEIVPRLPFVEGTVFRFNLLMVGKLEVKTNHEIKYKGLDEVEVNNTSRTLHKFEQKGWGTKQIDYWVDDNHQLIRVLRDKKEELVLSSQAEVKRLARNWPIY